MEGNLILSELILKLRLFKVVKMLQLYYAIVILSLRLLHLLKPHILLNCVHLCSLLLKTLY